MQIILKTFVLRFWKYTPFAESNPVPVCLGSPNQDGTLNISYCAGTPGNIDRSKESYLYTIDQNGMARVSETNEVLDLNESMQMFSVASTIIKDMYGEYDVGIAFKNFMNDVVNSED